MSPLAPAAAWWACAMVAPAPARQDRPADLTRRTAGGVDVDVETAGEELVDLLRRHPGPSRGDGAGGIAGVEDDVAVGARGGVVDVHDGGADDVVDAGEVEATV